jgi:hypothetical protein
MIGAKNDTHCDEGVHQPQASHDLGAVGSQVSQSVSQVKSSQSCEQRWISWISLHQALEKTVELNRNPRMSITNWLIFRFSVICLKRVEGLGDAPTRQACRARGGRSLRIALNSFMAGRCQFIMVHVYVHSQRYGRTS